MGETTQRFGATTERIWNGVKRSGFDTGLIPQGSRQGVDTSLDSPLSIFLPVSGEVAPSYGD